MARIRTTTPLSPEGELFGKRLRELRQKAGLTQEELLERAGISSLTYLSDLERGIKVPRLTAIIRLAMALDCKVTALVSPFDHVDLHAIMPKK